MAAAMTQNAQRQGSPPKVRNTGNGLKLDATVLTASNRYLFPSFSSFIAKLTPSVKGTRNKENESVFFSCFPTATTCITPLFCIVIIALPSPSLRGKRAFVRARVFARFAIIT